jgi:hypothetical protein
MSSHKNVTCPFKKKTKPKKKKIEIFEGGGTKIITNQSLKIIRVFFIFFRNAYFYFNAI